MSNSLVKKPVIETEIVEVEVAGLPYKPGQPARMVYESRNVCGWRYTVPGRFVYTNEPGGGTKMVFIPDDKKSLGGSAGVYSCRIEDVPVTYPATPPQYPTPPTRQRVARGTPTFNLGWNAGGRSKKFITEDGYIEFKVRASVVGVICGLNCDDGVDGRHTGKTIDYAFICQQGIARIYESGHVVTFAGFYEDSTNFNITRDGTDIIYSMDGLQMYSSVGAPTSVAWLEAALYSAYDEVFDPSITQVSPPDLTALSGDMALVLPHVDTLMADHAYGEMNLALPPLQLVMEQGLSLPAYGVMDLRIPPAALAMDGLTGEIGSFVLTLPPADMLFADHPYGEMLLELSPMDMHLDALEGNFRAGMSARSLSVSEWAYERHLVVNMRSGGGSVSALEVALRRPAGMRSGARSLADYDTEATYRVIMQSVAIARARLGAPLDEMETWVVNLEGFGSTTYSAFDFNSFARIGDQFYGAKRGGVFLLEGDDDAGAPIRAAIDFGRRDFGSSAKKTVSECFIGVSGLGNLFVKIVADGHEYLFKTANATEEMQQQRVKMAKGIKANYTTLILYNEDGQDFEIDTVEFVVADMQRKT